jgi:hypothetical protein
MAGRHWWAAATFALVVCAVVVSAQEHQHLAAASGVPHGVPRFCPSPTITSVASGAWSNPRTWSPARLPAPGDAVLVARDTTLAYDVVADAALACVDVEGTLAFRTDIDTRLTVATLTVLPIGRLEIGSAARPVAAGVQAELVFADRPIDTARDPEQLGNGLVGLGRVTMHGAIKTPTFVRLRAEPTAGDRTVSIEETLTGWRPGDRIVLPDTRQLRQNERGSGYRPQWDERAVVAIGERVITLDTALAFTHPGARDGNGRIEFLPHLANLTRNIVLRSQNPTGTRGHVIFIGRPDVDIRYVAFRGLGRTRMGVLDNAEYNADGSVRRVGANQIGRYSLHFHHAFGPRAPRADGYQFAVVGNVIDDGSKWGITIHNSHYGLVRDNVVYNSRGAGIVTEDGTESFNVIEHNFALRSEGTGEFAPRSGYGGPTPDPGGEGAGFWFRGPNNIIRNNVAANADVFGFAMAAGSLGVVRMPNGKGADPSQPGQYREVDTTAASVLEFSGNEAYGAIQTGVALGWNGVVSNIRVWHASRHALTAYPADTLTVDGFVARGDDRLLADGIENPTGIWFNNYAAKTVTIRHADVRGLRVGVASPFFVRSDGEPGRGDGRVLIEDGYFKDYVGVAVATAYSTTDLRAPIKRAEVRATRFDPLAVRTAGPYLPAAISMNYGMSSGDPQRRDPVVVYDFNAVRGDTFRVFYSRDLPSSAAPCGATRPLIGGFVCAGDGAATESRR